MWNNILTQGCGERLWTTSEATFSTLSLRTHILAALITEEDKSYLRGCGFSIRISVIWGLMPGPLSPSLVLYLISGNISQALSQDFLAAVQPAVEERIRTWPPPKVTRHGQERLDLDARKDPWTLIASCASFDGTNIGDLAMITDNLGISAVSQQLRQSVVFGSNAESISEQARISALRSGVDLTCIPETIPFSSLFDPEPDGDDLPAIDGVIRDIYAGRVITSPQQVITRLTTRSIEDQQLQGTGWNENLDYVHLECLFMAHFRRYILGGDGTNRARKVVRLMTGDEYLPLTPLGNLTINFVPFINENDAEVFAHTCFHQLDVLINENIAERLIQTLYEDLSQYTIFDATMDAICSVDVFTGE